VWCSARFLRWRGGLREPMRVIRLSIAGLVVLALVASFCSTLFVLSNPSRYHRVSVLFYCSYFGTTCCLLAVFTNQHLRRIPLRDDHRFPVMLR
jgi:hypothetical protein